MAQPLSVVPSESSPLRQAWPDCVGVIASIGCAIHCVAMPLVLAYLPALGLSWLTDSSFHRWMAGGCFLLAIVAFGPGWKCHRRVAPALIGSLGVALLVIGSVLVQDDCCASCAAPPVSHDCDAGATKLCRDTYDCESIEAPTSTWLLTPLGGALLVVGHVANHRCRCAACRSTDV